MFTESENGYQNHEQAPVDHMDTIPDNEQEIMTETVVDSAVIIPLVDDISYSNYVVPEYVKKNFFFFYNFL